MSSAAYVQGIKDAYLGEAIGERLFRRLAEQSDNADRAAMLNAIADVEELTRRKLQPIAQRLGVSFSEGDVTAAIEGREGQLTQISWAVFIQEALRDWPHYVAQFVALARMAPDMDKALLRVLVEHERALVEFVRMEQAQLNDSLSPLRAFLQAHAG